MEKDLYIPYTSHFMITKGTKSIFACRYYGNDEIFHVSYYDKEYYTNGECCQQPTKARN